MSTPMGAFPVFALLGVLLIAPDIASAIPQKGEPAPPFKVTSTSGQQITAANYRGSVLLLEFFTTWCSSCRKSVPQLVTFTQKFGKQGFHVLGVSLDDDDAEMAVREFITANRVNYPVAIAGEEMKDDYAIRSVPVIYVIGKKGVIAEKFMGFNEDIERRIDQLLRKLLAE